MPSQAIDMDQLFASSSTHHDGFSAQSGSTTSSQSSALKPAKGIDLLDSIFKSVSTSDGGPPPQQLPIHPAPVVTFLSCSENLLLKLQKQSNGVSKQPVPASLAPTQPHRQPAPVPPAYQQQPQQQTSEQHLLSLLGLQMPLPPRHAPPPSFASAVAPPVDFRARPDHAASPVLLSTLFSTSRSSISRGLALSAFRRELLMQIVRLFVSCYIVQ